MESYKGRSRPAPKPMSPAARWVREWVPQDVVATGGRCYLLKWVTEDKLHAIREKYKEVEQAEQKSEPTTEMLFLCTYDRCGKTFAEVGALRKHTHIHGERQYVCPVEGCGKKFLDSSKLKRHNLIHTGEKNHCCPYEGCGKAFSLDFNLRAHVKIHSGENYHLCPYPDCGKKYTNESKLKSHIKTHHEKNATANKRPSSEKLPVVAKNKEMLAVSGKVPEKHHIARKVPEKLRSTGKVPEKPGIVGKVREELPVAAKATAVCSQSSDRPFGCPFPDCGKTYLHVYKLNLHLKTQHPTHNPEKSEKLDGSGDARIVKSSASMSNSKRGRTDPARKILPAKVAKRRGSNHAAVASNDARKHRPGDELDTDSEETEGEVDENGWRYLYTSRDDEDIEEDEY
ncbi:hypothetical protein KSP40_PGU005995 [Platanthera guangdongensis]|uniref:C2H2-type domain-containing protein n=1 Tax=Platanthera guangdongensis TaxID=2320717 RepID=A0ABR2MRH9_9ASPA